MEKLDISPISHSQDIEENKSSIKSRYRPEIDGLRAFAVITVIINHFNKDTLPNWIPWC